MERASEVTSSLYHPGMLEIQERKDHSISPTNTVRGERLVYQEYGLSGSPEIRRNRIPPSEGRWSASKIQLTCGYVWVRFQGRHWERPARHHE